MTKKAKEKTTVWVRVVNTEAGRMGLVASEQGLIVSSMLGWGRASSEGPSSAPAAEKLPAGRPNWAAARERARQGHPEAPPRVNTFLEQADQALRDFYSFWPECPGDRISVLWRDLLAVPVDLGGLTAFTRNVLENLREVPPGQVISYGALAARAGSPKAARAVGMVMARNPVPVILPCHRVIAGDGSLGGFSGGKTEEALALKSSLLRYEGWTLAETRPEAEDDEADADAG